MNIAAGISMILFFRGNRTNSERLSLATYMENSWQGALLEDSSIGLDNMLAEIAVEEP